MGASPVLTGSAATSPRRGAVPHTGTSSASPILEPGAAARCHLTTAQQAQVSRLETLGRVAYAVCPSDEALERLCAEAIRRVVFAAVGVALLDLYGPLVADKDLLLDNVYSDLWGVTCTQVCTLACCLARMLCTYHCPCLCSCPPHGLPHDPRSVVLVCASS